MNKKDITKFILVLKTAYPYSFKDMSEEDTENLVDLYCEMLCKYNSETLEAVAKEIVKTRKFMPSISEIIDLCKEKKVYKRNEIIELMIKDGYFKSPREIEKVYMWIDEGIIPSWLQEDMKKYYNKGLENKEIKLLES